jgi:hypothetical protein
MAGPDGPVDPDTIDTSGNRPHGMDEGLYGFRLDVSDPFAETMVRAYFSRSVDLWNGWVKHDSIHGWQDYSGYATYSKGRTVVTLELVDGGCGDADGTANGVIIDPSGPRIFLTCCLTDMIRGDIFYELFLRCRRSTLRTGRLS